MTKTLVLQEQLKPILPLTEVKTAALCHYLSVHGWTQAPEQYNTLPYRKMVDSKPVVLHVPKFDWYPSIKEATARFVDVIEFLTRFDPLEQIVSTIQTHESSIQKERELRVQNHKVHVNEAGVAISEDRWGVGLCVRLEPREAIAQAEYILAMREKLEQLQRRLEETWGRVAMEAMVHFILEERDLADVDESEVAAYLESVAGADAKGYLIGESKTFAGSWYKSLYDESGDTKTYEQQWIPFWRIWQQEIQQEKR